MPNVSNIVKTIQDIMRKDAGTYGDAQRLEQLGWMFFLKIFDDREKELELLRDDYKSPLPRHLRWSSWAADEEGITGDALLDFVNGMLLPKLQSLPGGASRMAGLIRMTFEDANNYMKNGTLMRQVINKINGIDFNASDDRHMFGDIYEKLLKDLQSAGNAGEFYTPRAVTQFIVEQVNPRLGETILDPACGTGGFLVCAIEHLRKQAKTDAHERTIQECFSGIEKKHLPHVLCMTNLLLHGIDVPSNVRHDNTLKRPLRDWSPRERVDVIVTNPPFGGMEEDGIETNFPSEFRTRETADLFLVLIMRLLKPGGRAGLVLPDGTLFGEGVKTRIKESLLAECNLHTIVRLPNGVFNPYTGIRTNLLFFTKGEPTKDVWYYEHPYPPGAKSYNKGKPIRIEEFEPERAWWNNRAENDQAWRVPLDQLKATNYNLDIKNPHNPDTGPGDVDQLLPEYEKLLAQIAETRAKLKKELHQSHRQSRGRRMTPETFFEKFELFTGAPNAVEKVRELILELAATGRLTEQSEKEEPAGRLRSRIEQYLRDQNGSPWAPVELPESSALPDLPRSWQWVPLGNVTAYGAADKVESTEVPGDSWLLDLEDIQKNTSKLLQRKTFSESPSKSTKSAFQKGDVLYGKLRPYLNKVMVADSPGYCTTEIIPIRTYGFIEPRYLCYALRRPAFVHYATSKSYGMNLPRLGTEDARRAPFPLPPFAEQKRIVAKVDQLMALLDQLESQLAASRGTAANLLSALVAEMTLQK